jgi:hypothetical protein
LSVGIIDGVTSCIRDGDGQKACNDTGWQRSGSGGDVDIDVHDYLLKNADELTLTGGWENCCQK